MKLLILVLFLCMSPLLGRDQIGNVVTAEMKAQDIPGVAIAFYTNGQGYLYCYGFADKQLRSPVTPDTLFNLASITKVFVTTDMALQIDAGKMFLQDSISKYLGELSKDTPIDQVSLLNLATHTSSLPRGLPQNSSQEDIYDFLNKWNPPYPIGSRYTYSNLGFWLLGFALESLEHTSYETLLRDELFMPLGMTSTVITVPDKLQRRLSQGYSKGDFAVPQQGIGPGRGSIKSTASDMLRFLQANLGVNDSSKFKAAITLAQKGEFRVNDTLTLGLGWQRFTDKNGHLFIDKNGGVEGFSSYIGMLPDKKMGIVILANKSGVNCTKLGRHILSK